MGSIPGLGRSPGEGNGHPLQYSSLENSMHRGAWRATVRGVTKSRTRLSDQQLWAGSTLSPVLGRGQRLGWGRAFGAARGAGFALGESAGQQGRLQPAGAGPGWAGSSAAPCGRSPAAVASASAESCGGAGNAGAEASGGEGQARGALAGPRRARQVSLCCLHTGAGREQVCARERWAASPVLTALRQPRWFPSRFIFPVLSPTFGVPDMRSNGPLPRGHPQACGTPAGLHHQLGVWAPPRPGLFPSSRLRGSFRASAAEERFCQCSRHFQ